MRLFKENGGLSDDAIAVAKSMGCPINQGDMNDATISQSITGTVGSGTFWQMLSLAMLAMTVEQMQGQMKTALDEILQELKRLRHSVEVLADHEAPEPVEE